MMRRILFVDDEPRILEGLRRMLHGERDHWDLRFAGSGAAALAELAREPADVVVTDMRMPGMDGAELLARVATVAPDAIRIVLSGQTDDLASTRTVPVAHQFLTKPCQAQVLREVVERACALRELLASPGLRRLIKTVDTLPSVPAKVKAASPLTYLKATPAPPPFFLAHGRQDCNVPHGQVNT